MNHEAMRMIAHVDQFRALARIGGEDDLVRSSVDLGNLVKMIVDERKDELAAREISVRMHMLPTIDAYEHLVIVLYRNLLDNGIIHSTGEDRIIEFTAESTAGGWILGVRNSGSVIPEPDLERIFEPFTTLHQRADRAGFGLAIARRIVERHAGWIRAASGPDTVHVRFMLNVENEAHDEDDQPPDDRNDPARRHGGR
ncbi:MAG: HAMP domain-containing histidine kinase [Phycisphaerales bacterium]|nr:HAMP domain-containing histidine kinase [Phycisphaerales bacterium]